MDPQITCKTILIPANRAGVVEEGLLIFADNQLMAVVIHLQQVVSEQFRGLWHLEAGFGPCAITEASRLAFPSPREAQLWVREQVSRARAN